MDKINKALKKLNFKKRRELKEILLKINSGNFQGLDLKKLKARNNIFRVRKSNMRIILHKTDNFIKILSVEYRASNTCKKK